MRARRITTLIKEMGTRISLAVQKAADDGGCETHEGEDNEAHGNIEIRLPFDLRQTRLFVFDLQVSSLVFSAIDLFPPALTSHPLFLLTFHHLAVIIFFFLHELSRFPSQSLFIPLLVPVVLP